MINSEKNKRYHFLESHAPQLSHTYLWPGSVKKPNISTLLSLNESSSSEILQIPVPGILLEGFEIFPKQTLAVYRRFY